MKNKNKNEKRCFFKYFSFLNIKKNIGVLVVE
jgi:hypothetical protein